MTIADVCTPGSPFADWCPDREDAEFLRILSDQFEELGRDASAAMLRDVASRIEHGFETYRRLAELLYVENAAMRSALGRSGAVTSTGNAPHRALLNK